MTPKTSWNKFKPSATLTSEQLETEKLLTLRLKPMGYLLFLFCIASLVAGVLLQDSEGSTAPSTPATPTRLSPLERSLPPSFFLEETSEEIELNAAEVLNFYFISLTFAAAGSLCLLYSHKKHKKLLSIQPITNEQQEI